MEEVLEDVAEPGAELVALMDGSGGYVETDGDDGVGVIFLYGDLQAVG